MTAKKSSFKLLLVLGITFWIITLGLLLQKRSSFQLLQSQFDQQHFYLQTLEKATFALNAENFEEAAAQFELLDSLQGKDNQYWIQSHRAATRKREQAANLRDSLYRNNNELVNEIVKKIRSLQRMDQKLNATQYALDSVENLIFSLKDSQSVQLLQLSQLRAALDQALGSYQKLNFKTEDGKGVRYFGQTKNGQAAGFGVGIIESGGIYEGYWLANQRHGEGIYTYANGDVYNGNYSRGKRNGSGTYTFVSGEKYEGDWKDELRHGKGKLLDAGGHELLNGDWENDRFLRQPAKSKNDTITLP